ncbi:unnamed protein product [Ambrosiozyma monospora]|uniref:Unnamed protein product n=1 Tax=Ambrosiozyma monospora TaxID=43982 RepID=A0ACB5STA7_AMBMO|nr:unnamed protein product [Ambrosiozyma monospora]
MLEFGDDESVIGPHGALDDEGQISKNTKTQQQDWSTVQIVSKIVNQLPKSVISLKIKYPNEFFYNSYLDLRYLEQLVELHINGPWISHYKIFDRLPIELLKLVIHYHSVESTKGEDVDGMSDSHESHNVKLSLELEFHQLKSTEDFSSSQIVIENNDDEDNVSCDVTVKLSSSLLRCLSNYIIDSQLKCQFGSIVA